MNRVESVRFMSRYGVASKQEALGTCSALHATQRSARSGFSNIEAHDVIVHHESAADVLNYRFDDRETVLGVGGNRRGVMFVDGQHERIAAAGARKSRGVFGDSWRLASGGIVA